MKFTKFALVSVTTAIMGMSAISCTSTKKNAGASSDVGSSKATSVELYTIYFDFDKYNIRADQRDNAAKMVQSLKDHPNAKVQVQGNTDDRGSVEYNMALGTKRAEALKNYLVTSGVNSDNVDTVSYGKERPAVQGNDESAWEQNRRDDVVLVGE